MMQKEDIRKTRTKKMLVEALLELLKKKELHEIKIKDLTEKAMVSRQTFYRHYELIEELFRDCVEDLFGDMNKELVDSYDKEEQQDLEHNLIIAFRVFYKYRSTLSILLSVSDKDLIIKNLHRQYEHGYENEGRLEYTTPDASSFQYLYIGYEAGGLYVLLKEWLTEKEPISPEKMAKIYIEIRNRPFY